MATHTIRSAAAVSQSEHLSLNLNFIQRINKFADSQQQWAMLWWLGSLMIIGSFLLPVSFLLVYSLDGPVVPLLALSMVSFFASIIANMGSMGIRACVYTFLFSLILHAAIIIGMLLAWYL